VTIIFVTHDQLEAMVLSDRVVVMREGAIQQIGTPTEIYRQPANRFVADFIGVANFIECQRTEDGLRPLGAPDVVLPVTPPEHLADDRVTLMVRPEEIEMDQKEGQISALVDKRMFLGDATEYIVLLGQQALRVKTEPKVDFASNETVYLTITKCHFFETS
jgi:ABC-type Fe3+/spermidine/putrescine transport system ATPase subunit